MKAVWYAALGTGFTFLMTALGAAAVFFVRKGKGGETRRICLGFAAGVMIAATVWSLILPALESARGGIVPVVGGLLLGTLFLLLLEVLMQRLRPLGGLTGEWCKAARGTGLLYAAVTLHNIPEGMAVGLSFALAVRSGQPAQLLGACSLALGVGVQNLPEGAALSLPLREEGMTRGRAFWLGAASALVEPVFGVLTVLAVTAVQPLLPILLAFAAGAMLIVSVRELIPNACCGDARYAGTLSVMVGFVLMMILDIALG